MRRVIEAITAELSSPHSSDARRLFRGRGQCFDGLGFINVDWFEPVLLITLYQQPDDQQWAEFITGLEIVKSLVACAVVQHRYIRGGPIDMLWGELPSNVIAKEYDLAYELSLGAKQNIGFFLDMEPGRQWLQQRSNGKRILNLFSYTCSFSVAAIAGGARTVVNADMSKAALTVGRNNHRLNGHEQALKRDIQFLPYDIFRSWKKIISKGPYDIVIIDPPSRQKGSFIADTDYAKVLRRLPSLLAEGGDALVCLNAPELGENFLVDAMAEHCPTGDFVERLANRKDFPESDPQRNLKMLHYRIL